MKRDFAFLAQPDLQKVLRGLGKSHEARVVGGAVRNALMDLPVADIDLGTTATPDEVMAIASVNGWRALPTGIAHGTITLICDGHTFEVTTLREDVATDGRHAEVLFGTDFVADAQRRDFTVNAMSVSADGTLHDYTNGEADLAARNIRFIGNADTRIKEDYLRILRFFRFASAYGEGPLDPDALHAIINNRFGLKRISKERIGHEILKTLLTRRAPFVFRTMSDTGILQQILSGIGNPARLDRYIALDAYAGRQPDAIARLAALALFSTNDIPRLRESLRLPNADTERLTMAGAVYVPMQGLHHPPDKGRLRELMFDHGKAACALALSLAHAQSSAAIDDQAWASASRFVADTPQPTLPFTGADLLARGIDPGKHVGLALKRLQSLWIRAGFPKEPQDLAALLDAATSDVANSGSIPPRK